MKGICILIILFEPANRNYKFWYEWTLLFLHIMLVACFWSFWRNWDIHTVNYSLELYSNIHITFSCTLYWLKTILKYQSTEWVNCFEILEICFPETRLFPCSFYHNIFIFYSVLVCWLNKLSNKILKLTVLKIFTKWRNWLKLK